MTSRIRIHPVELELAQPLVTGAGTTRRREVLLVEVVDVDGTTGWGEAAPLPSWPGPDLATVRHQLDTWASGGEPPVGGAAKAAVEMALLDIEAQRAGVSVANLFANGAPPSVPVNALLDHLDPNDLGHAASLAIAEGFAVLKIKVGTTRNDVDRVRAVRSVAPNAVIRLDANRAWTEPQAVEFCAAVESLDIEFIEEPIGGGVDALAALQPKVGIDIGADESLAEIATADLEAVDLPVLVVKPSALGGFRSLVALGQQRRIVVTSFLESAVGVAAASHVAAALHVGNPEQPGSGLATSSRFVADIAPGGVLERGMLRVPVGPGLGVVPVLP